MKGHKWFFLILPFFLIIGLNQGCGGGGDDGDETPTSPTASTTTDTTTTTAAPGAPSCTITANPQLANYHQDTELTINITGGPANGSFSVPTGTCTSFTNIASATCKIRVGEVGKNTMTFLVSNANGGSSCFVDVYGGHFTYMVENLGPHGKFSNGDGACVWISSDPVIENNLALGHPAVKYYGQFPTTLCSGSVSRDDTMTYEDAVRLDSPLNGGNFNGIVSLRPKGEV